MKYIYVEDKKYRVLDEYDKDKSHYVVYKRDDLKKGFFEKIGIVIKRGVMKNGWVEWTGSYVNKWNPLTYIALAVVVIYVFFTEGISGIKEQFRTSPFKMELYSSYWHKQEDVKMTVEPEPLNLTLFIAVLIFILAVSLICNIAVLIGKVQDDKEKTSDDAIAEIVKMEEPKDDSLSDWELFTLALVKVESEYNPDAVSSVGAKGYFQMTPIYVAEVNRVWGTNYKYEDVVKSFDLSYEVFDLMQQAHNPDYDKKKALELHNGKHEWYNRRVFNAMSEIKTYEEMRCKVKKM